MISLYSLTPHCTPLFCRLSWHRQDSLTDVDDLFFFSTSDSVDACVVCSEAPHSSSWIFNQKAPSELPAFLQLKPAQRSLFSLKEMRTLCFLLSFFQVYSMFLGDVYYPQKFFALTFSHQPRFCLGAAIICMIILWIFQIDFYSFSCHDEGLFFI